MKDRGAWRAAVHGVAELDIATEPQMTAYLICIWEHPEGRESQGRGKEREDVYSGHLICLNYYVQGLVELGPWGHTKLVS